MLLLPHRSILGLAKLASRTTMRFSNVLVTRIPFYNRRCRLLSTAVGASLAGRHKVRMPVRLGENETGGLVKADRQALKPRSELSVEWHKFWWDATVKEVDSEGNRVLVGFDAWDSRWDEWMPIDSNRLRNRLTTEEAMHTSGTIAPSQRPSPIERRPIATVERTEETGGLGVAEGWEELRAEDGTPYYHNKATGLTQWERPGTLPEGWQELRTADGTPYYYHEASSKTVWERPGGGEEVPVGLEHKRVTGATQSTVAEASIEASKEGGEDTAVVLEGWREFKTDDGTTYYYNESTGVTQWERPGNQPRPVELLVGWEELKADDGTPYYYNSTTGVTQWELPVARDTRKGDVETPSGKRAREALPDSWEMFHADDGTPYYYNSTTGVTQWELPTESSVVSEEKDAVVSRGALPADWEEFHADDGTPYYYNSTTGQTQWEHPGGAHAEDCGLVKSRVGEHKGLPEGWEELIADDGTPYYHQVDTGLTQWEFPTVLSASVKCLPEGWQQLKADDGTPYYHNSTTGATQWDVPSEVRTDKEAPTAAEVVVAALKELPDGWDCVLTPEGRELYFQAGELGRTSTWSRP